MSRKRTSGALVLAVAGACGCSAYSTYKNVNANVDCTASDGYDFDSANQATAFSFGDTTTGGSNSAAIATLPDGARCSNTQALHIQVHHNNDWGAAAGFYGFINMGVFRDESAYEGMAFWARAPGATGKSFSIVLDDYNTRDPTPLPPGETDAAAGGPPDSNCVGYSTPDGGVSITYIDPATGVVLSSNMTTVTAPNACGNSYVALAVVTADWRFYTIPFERFHQAAMPNRVPNPTLEEAGPVPGTGILISKLTNLILRFPKEAEVDLWLDNLSFYRKKGSVRATDGGANSQ